MSVNSITLSSVTDLRQLTTLSSTLLYLEGEDGGVWQYDPDDTTTADDGILTVVTTGGARIKRIYDGHIDLAWADVDYANANIALQKVIDIITALAVARGNTEALPRIKVSAGEYFFTATVTLPAFVQIDSVGTVTFRTESSTLDLFTINAMYDGVNGGESRMAGNHSAVLNGTNGAIFLRGPGRTVSTMSGINFGNTETGKAPCRNVQFKNVIVVGFQNGIKFNLKNTYLTYFDGCHFEQNHYNVFIPAQTSTDSGERISMNNCTLAACGDSHLNVQASGIDINFINCSFDFSHAYAIRVGANAGYSKFSFDNCHFEDWDQTFMYCEGTVTLANLSFYFTNSLFLPRAQGNTALTNSPSRPLFALQNGVIVYIDNYEVRVEKRAYSDSLEWNSTGLGSIKVKNMVKGSIPKMPDGLQLLRDNDFSVDVIGSSVGSNWTITSGSVANVVEAITDTTGTTTNSQVMKLTGSGSSSYWKGTSKLIPTSPGDTLAGHVALSIGSATGSFTTNVQFTYYDKDGVSIGSSTAYQYDMSTSFQDTSIPGYTTNGGLRYLASTPGVRVVPSGAAYFTLSATISNFSGEVRVSKINAYKL